MSRLALDLVASAAINHHPLLDGDQQRMCKVMRNASKKDGTSFELLDFAKIALRACGKDYGAAIETGTMILADVELRKAAVLYVYEALKASDNAMIKEWPQFDEMLKTLVMLTRDLP